VTNQSINNCWLICCTINCTTTKRQNSTKQVSYSVFCAGLPWWICVSRQNKHNTTQRKHKTGDSSNKTSNTSKTVAAAMQTLAGCSGDRLILRELLLLPSPFLVICVCCILFVVIYNIFWWSDPIQDVIVNSFTFTMSTSSFVPLFSTPHAYRLWGQRIASGYYISSELSSILLYWLKWISSFHLIR
jgi:hypothetical protein